MFLDNVAYLERKYVLSRQKNGIAKVKNIAQPWGKKEFGHKLLFESQITFCLNSRFVLYMGPVATINLTLAHFVTYVNMMRWAVSFIYFSTTHNTSVFYA